MYDKDKFAENMRKAREAASLDVFEVAKRTSMSACVIESIESAQDHDLFLSEAVELCDLYGVTVGEMLEEAPTHKKAKSLVSGKSCMTDEDKALLKSKLLKIVGGTADAGRDAPAEMTLIVPDIARILIDNF